MKISFVQFVCVYELDICLDASTDTKQLRRSPTKKNVQKRSVMSVRKRSSITTPLRPHLRHTNQFHALRLLTRQPRPSRYSHPRPTPTVALCPPPV